MRNIFFVATLITLSVSSCKQPLKTSSQQAAGSVNWKKQFDATLLLLGHRNWIIIADKAFPFQYAAGMEYINTGENLLPVLKYVLQQVDASGHVKPIIYRDKELGFITEEQSKGVKSFANESQKLFGSQPVETLLHDSVFGRLDASAKLFKILVLKTNGTIPYTSVFLQLDCAYWSAEKEMQLRKRMNDK